MSVRIGIDVGGTFTDAVAIDNQTQELLGLVKVPTSHQADEGVALGIIDALEQLMSSLGIEAKEVAFLAHGTTQATNALLEGDVAEVGVVGMGQGLERLKARQDTRIDKIEVAPEKYVRTGHCFVNTGEPNFEIILEECIQGLRSRGFGVVVAAEPYSVDNPTNENLVLETATDLNIPATATHEISKLYGLKIRTRTAVINGSILPKMMETANMTEASINRAGIKAPLMVMRCDGGVMNMAEVRKRPIMTFLSGPAAGVAGALMYERVTDGIFLEVGGTSTDISAIHHGQVMMKFAEVGGHKTYLNSLDVRTVGIAGGSMVRVHNGTIKDVGPRSAHVAGMGYATLADPKELVDAKVSFVKPCPGDPEDYLVLINGAGRAFALTVTCAANYLGLVNEDDYAKGNQESARIAFEVAAREFSREPWELAEAVMEIGSEKCVGIIQNLMTEYDLDAKLAELVGGGGGCSALVPYLARKMGLRYRIARNCEVISSIGVAVAMVRDVVERTIPNPGKDDILKVRREAEEAVRRAGAKEETIEVQVQIETDRNLVRAIAIGSTELKEKDIKQQVKGVDELRVEAAEYLRLEENHVALAGSTGYLFAFLGKEEKKSFFGLRKICETPLRVLNGDGVVRLQMNQAEVETCKLRELTKTLDEGINRRTFYGDGGAEIPDIFILCGARLLDLSGLLDREQVVSVARVELDGYEPDEDTVLIYGRRGG